MVRDGKPPEVQYWEKDADMRCPAVSSIAEQLGHLVSASFSQYFRRLPVPHHPEHCLPYQSLYILNLSLSARFTAPQSTLSKTGFSMRILPFLLGVE